MAKLKTPEVITPEEYQQAELAGTLTIAKEIVCSYCQDPVEIQDPLQFHCQRHGWLELRMYDNPGYPAVVNEYYGTMMFYFDVIREIPLEAHRRLLAQYKGCPFCNRNLSPKERNVDIAQQSLFCEQCRVSFRIGVIEQRMRFQPESKHFVAQHATDVDIQQVETNRDTQTRETVEAESEVAPVAAKMTRANTIVEFQEVYGGSYERARQLWHKTGGKEHKDDVDAELRARARDMRDQDMTLEQIANILGKNKSTISRWLKESVA